MAIDMASVYAAKYRKTPDVLRAADAPLCLYVAFRHTTTRPKTKTSSYEAFRHTTMKSFSLLFFSFLPVCWEKYRRSSASGSHTAFRNL